jgi:hypothetical protein
MAEIEDLIFTRLSGFAGLAALVGDRIYPGAPPQDVTKPYVRYSLVIGQTPQPQQVVGQTDLIRARYQFDAFDSKPAGARAVRNQLRLALKRWSSAGPPVVQVTFFVSSIDLREPDTKLHNMSSDYEINYEE